MSPLRREKRCAVLEGATAADATVCRAADAAPSEPKIIQFPVAVSPSRRFYSSLLMQLVALVSAILLINGVIVYSGVT